MSKGDKRRPTAISDSAFSMKWCATMGHKMRESSDVCINCGKTAKEIVDGDEGLVQPKRRQKRSAAKNAEQ